MISDVNFDSDFGVIGPSTLTTARKSLTTTLFFDAATNLVVRFIPGRERGLVIVPTKTKTIVGWLVV